MISKSIRTGFFILAITSFSFGGAQEKLKPQNEEAIKSFKTLDTNFDEAISLEEYKTNRKKDESNEDQVKNRFMKMDIDGNGSINLEEYTYIFESSKKTVKKRKLKMTEEDMKKD